MRVAGRLAWGLTIVCMAVAVGTAALSSSTSTKTGGGAEQIFDLPFAVGFAIEVGAFALVGALIVSRQPTNLVGWLFVGDATLLTLTVSAGIYADRALRVEGGAWPAGEALALVGDVLYTPLFAALTVFLFLLYPNGRLPGVAERRVAFVAVAAIGLSVVAGLVEPHLYGYPAIANPLGWRVPQLVYDVLGSLAFFTLLGCLVAAFVLLIRRLRRAHGPERDQLRLLVFGSLLGTALFVPSFFTDSPSDVIVLVSGIGILLIPGSVGVAILRHRLFDLDIVIRRTVVFGVLAAFITLIYLAIVVAIPAAVLGRRGEGFDVLPLVATAVIAVAFQPVQRWARRLASRLAYGDRASPYDVLAELASRMADTYDAADLLPRIARGLAEGSGAARADVWLRIGEELRPAASWPGTEALRPVPIASDDVPALPADHAVPVRHLGELLGALTVDTQAGVALTSTEARLLEDVASQAGIALRNARLTEELRANVEQLRASRQRLVAAQDTERRRLERDIHDGAQQQLVALSVKAGLAERLVEGDPSQARAVLSQVREEAAEALEGLRDLARGIYPPVLADRGLEEALRAQARKAALPVVIDADGLGRYAQETESTVYFCCLEAVQNAAKYSGANEVVVTLTHDDGVLRFSVHDGGRGFDPTTTRLGMGVTNMRDRVEAMGGTLEIRSAPGNGTTVMGSVPIP